MAMVEGRCRAWLDITTIHQASTNAEAGSASWVGIHFGSTGQLLKDLTREVAQFDAVKALGEHVCVVVLAADVTHA
jgi:hypothetical protein